MDPKPPGHWSWIIDMCVPWIIIVSCSIDYYSTVYITMRIPGQVTYIYYLGGRLIYVGIFYIVNRRFGWQVIHLIGALNTNFPWTGWFC